jgi:carboxymethylenebutenolidase
LRGKARAGILQTPEKRQVRNVMYRNLVCKEVLYQGHGNQTKNAYFAAPEGAGPFPAVVFIHHLPGWNEVCIETVRRFAHHGYMAISMNLYSAYGEGDADDIGARARADGGVSDEQMLGDVAGATAYLRAQAGANGKVGVMGYCSG